jgi:hypothetical protein
VPIPNKPKKRGRPKTKTAVKGTQQGVPLTNTDREVISQLFLVVQNKAEVARKLGLAYSTVCQSLAKTAKDDTAGVKAERQKSARAIAGKLHHKTHMVLDAITDADLKSGIDVVKDKDGNVTKHVPYGPSLMQKVTAGAILADKLKVVRDYELALDADRAEGHLPLPVRKPKKQLHKRRY